MRHPPPWGPPTRGAVGHRRKNGQPPSGGGRWQGEGVELGRGSGRASGGGGGRGGCTLEVHTLEVHRARWTNERGLASVEPEGGQGFRCRCNRTDGPVAVRRTDGPIHTFCTPSTATFHDTYPCNIRASTLALQNQHHNANLACAR